MPARSKSQQRLFGMVHAYNKGEFHGSESARRVVSTLAKRISKDDARHFAETTHDNLPEKRAQFVMGPGEIRQMYGYMPDMEQLNPMGRSEKRRTFLGSIFRGTLAGAALGGLGVGAFGALLAHRAANGGAGMDPGKFRQYLLESGLRCGGLGAKWGAGTGAAVGTGLYVLDKVRG